MHQNKLTNDIGSAFDSLRKPMREARAHEMAGGYSLARAIYYDIMRDVLVGDGVIRLALEKKMAEMPLSDKPGWEDRISTCLRAVQK